MMAVEKFGGGFIVSDYTGQRGKFGAAYAGKDGVWRDQPVGMPPFATQAEADAFKQAALQTDVREAP